MSDTLPPAAPEGQTPAWRATGERRQSGLSADELRRHLRDADARYYDAFTAPVRRRPAPPRARVPATALGIAAGLAMVAVGEVMHVRRVTSPLAPPTAWRNALPARGGESARLQMRPEATAGRDEAVRPPEAGPAPAPLSRSSGFAIFDGELRVVTIADAGAHSDHVQASPDGRLIAFDSDRGGGGRAVYVARRDGTDVRRVSGEGYAALPAWAPDGRRLAFVKAEPGREDVWNLWLATVDSGLLQRLTNYSSGRTKRPSWFADGRRIGYGHGERLVILDLQSGRTEDYRTPVPGRELGAVAVSPDGRKVMFHVAQNGAWLLDLHDRSMTRALADPTVGAFAWAPDSKRLAFHSDRDDRWGVWMLTPAAKPKRQPAPAMSSRP